jgi:hypothetical protein
MDKDTISLAKAEDIINFSTDNGKPLETVGRKAKGPNSYGYGSRATEGRVFLFFII